MKIIVRTHNLETGEIVDIERDETPEEIAQREAFESELAKTKAEQLAKAEQRNAILERLGITEEEAKLLLG